MYYENDKIIVAVSSYRTVMHLSKSSADRIMLGYVIISYSPEASPSLFNKTNKNIPKARTWPNS